MAKPGTILRPLNNPAKYQRAEKYKFQDVNLIIDYLPSARISGLKFESKGRKYQYSKSGALINLNRKKTGKVRNYSESHL